MSTANIYTKEKVDELLNNLNSKFFILPSNITINQMALLSVAQLLMIAP